MARKHDKPKDAMIRYREVNDELAAVDKQRAALLAERDTLRADLCEVIPDGGTAYVRVGWRTYDYQTMRLERHGNDLTIEVFDPHDGYNLEWPTEAPAGNPDVLPIGDTNAA